MDDYALKIQLIRDNYGIYGNTELKRSVETLLEIVDDYGQQLDAADQFAQDCLNENN